MKIYDKQKKDELKRHQFIAEKLPEYFGVKATQTQRRLINGRHPNSLKKDDELWHYSRVSDERHRLVKGGRGFWGAIEASAKKHELSNPSQKGKTGLSEVEPALDKPHHETEKLQEPQGKPPSPSSFLPLPVIEKPIFTQNNPNNKVSFARSASIDAAVSPSTPGIAAGLLNFPSQKDSSLTEDKSKIKIAASLQAQLKTAMSTASNDLALKVDFSNRSLIHYNMSFMIMNYNNEVIYVDHDNLLRVKHISQLHPTDRVKFKMVDVSNPSNPSTLQFGANLWLQIVDNPDSVIDSTFQTGSVITTKLFTPTDVKGFTFEPVTQPVVPFAVTNGGLLNPTASFHNKNKNRTSVMMRPTASHVSIHRKSSSLPPFSTASSLTGGDFSASIFEGEEDRSVSSESDIGDDEDDSPRWKPKKNDVNIDGNSLEDAKRINRHNEEYKRKMKICGHVEATRIVDTKKTELLPESIILSDEKASRYVSRTATHLGKFTIESAVRMTDSNKVQYYFYRDLSHQKTERKSFQKDDNENQNDFAYDFTGASSENTHEMAFEVMMQKMKNADSVWVKDYIKTHLLSLTPIIIQQDQYCLSTATYEEYQQWPLDSSQIVASSGFITQEQRDMYEKQYEKFLTTQNQFNLLDSALDHHSANAATSMLKKIQQKKANQQYLLQQQQLQLQQSQQQSSNSGHHHHSRPNTSSSATHHATTSSSSSRPNTSNGKKGNIDGYCCLRRIVTRNAPYEFVIDHRCVWKLCLYEQFSDNYVQTEREKEVKKSMETATMVLKLSKLNREGARVHINANHLENLPSLVSGEHFPKQLRELRFKYQQKKNSEALSQRRLKEASLVEYFNDRITDVLEQEESGFRSGGSSLGSPSFEGSSFFTIPKMDGSNYSPLFATSDSHQYDSEYFLNQDDEEASFTEFSLQSEEENLSTIKKVRQRSALMTRKNSMMTAKGAINRQSSMTPNITTTNNNPSGITRNYSNENLSVSSQPKNVAGATTKVSFAEKTITVPGHSNHPSAARRPQTSIAENRIAQSKPFAQSQNSSSVYESQSERQSFSKEGNALPPRPHTSGGGDSSPKIKEYSEDIKRAFNTNIIPPYQKKLLLVNSSAVHEFDHLSTGEQLLSYHKTLAHISRVTRTAIEQKVPNFRTKQPNAAVLAKIQKLKEEDEEITQIMTFKDKLRRETEITESGL